jgi:hypothetical protein
MRGLNQPVRRHLEHVSEKEANATCEKWISREPFLNQKQNELFKEDNLVPASKGNEL